MSERCHVVGPDCVGSGFPYTSMKCYACGLAACAECSRIMEWDRAGRHRVCDDCREEQERFTKMRLEKQRGHKCLSVINDLTQQHASTAAALHDRAYIAESSLSETVSVLDELIALHTDRRSDCAAFMSQWRDDSKAAWQRAIALREKQRGGK